MPWKGQDTGCLLCRHSPARALMRERSNSLAVLLSLSSSSSERSKRVLMWLYCCVISTLSKSVVEVMAVASVASGRRDGGWRPQVLSVRREMSVGDEMEQRRIMDGVWNRKERHTVEVSLWLIMMINWSSACTRGDFKNKIVTEINIDLQRTESLSPLKMCFVVHSF